MKDKIRHFIKFKICYKLHCFVNKFYFDQKNCKIKRPYLRKLNNFLADLWIENYINKIIK